MQKTEQIDTNKKNFVDAKNVSKAYGKKTVLDGVNFTIGEGEIVGLIGPNGAGKSTLLKAIMGLIDYSGDLSIFSQNPFKNRTKLLQNMSYIADVASLPGWMKVADLLDFVAQTHPKFDHSHALMLLKDTPIELASRIEVLSKGMKTRLHLLIILSIKTDFLVLDEPTLGLDVLVRREFQDRLVQDYYNQQRSILITTHQVDEVESILTRVLFISEGKITLDIKKADLKSRYKKLTVKETLVLSNEHAQPIYQRTLPNQTEMIFRDTDEGVLTQYGEVETPSLEDLFVAINASSALVKVSMSFGSLAIDVNITSFLNIDETVDQAVDGAVDQAVFGSLWFVNGLITLVMVFVAVFYALSCLYTERQDQSVLFWRSLPISDSITVASKLFVALVITPLLIVFCHVVLSIIFLGLGSIEYLQGFILISISSTARITAWLLLPMVSWCLLCSEVAKRIPFLLAFIVPIIAVAVDFLFIDVGLTNLIFDRFLLKNHTSLTLLVSGVVFSLVCVFIATTKRSQRI